MAALQARGVHPVHVVTTSTARSKPALRLLFHAKANKDVLPAALTKEDATVKAVFTEEITRSVGSLTLKYSG